MELSLSLIEQAHYIQNINKFNFQQQKFSQLVSPADSCEC